MGTRVLIIAGWYKAIMDAAMAAAAIFVNFMVSIPIVVTLRQPGLMSSQRVAERMCNDDMSVALALQPCIAGLTPVSG